MRSSKEFIRELELLYEAYEKEVTEQLNAGVLKDSTAKTYLVTPDKFTFAYRSYPAGTGIS